MAQRTKSGAVTPLRPRSRTFGTAASTARGQFAWIWSRESVLRLALSFVLATALWLYVTSRQDPGLTQDYLSPISLETQHVNSALTVTSPLPAVHLRLRADQNTIVASPSSFHAFVNLAGYGPGPHRVKIHVLADPGITVVQWTPTYANVRLDRLIQQFVPVRWHIYGKPVNGYATGDVAVNPSTVRVSGPSIEVSQVTQAVVYVDVSQSKATVQGVYKPALKNSQNVTIASTQINVDPPSVRVTAPILPLSGFKTLPIVANIQGTPRPDLGVVDVDVSPFEVTVHASPGTLGRLSAVSTSPILVSTHNAGTFTQSATLLLSAGIRSNVSRVTVRVLLGPVASSASIQVPVVAQNVGTGLAVHISPATTLVTVLGPAQAIQVATGRLVARVRVAGLGAGTYRLRPIVQTPAGLRVAAIYPTRITVRLAPVKKR